MAGKLMVITGATRGLGRGLWTIQISSAGCLNTDSDFVGDRSSGSQNH